MRLPFFQRTAGPTARGNTVGDSATPTISFERGGRIYATDGPVGTLRNVVVDGEPPAVAALVVRPDRGSGHEAVLVPPELVDRGAGSALFLGIDRETFAACARQAVRYDPDSYEPFDPRKLLNAAAGLVGGWRVAAVERAALHLRAESVARSASATAKAPVPIDRDRSRPETAPRNAIAARISGVAD